MSDRPTGLTQLHQTYDLGDGELTIDLRLARPLPPNGWTIMSNLIGRAGQVSSDLEKFLAKEDADDA